MDKLVFENFTASVRYSEEDEIYVGSIDNIKSSVSFEGENIDELNEAFKEAVEDYVDFCKRKGIVYK